MKVLPAVSGLASKSDDGETSSSVLFLGRTEEKLAPSLVVPSQHDRLFVRSFYDASFPPSTQRPVTGMGLRTVFL